MIKENMHIHSNYSWDCKMKLNDIAETLVKNGISYATITDHVELDKEPLPYVLTSLKIRNVEIDRINEIYEGKLVLYKGVEISEPNLYPKEVELINELSLDLIMGSVHKIDRSAKTMVGIKNAYYEYYKRLMSMITTRKIDVVGHLDYINRYYDFNYFTPNQIKELLQAIKENNQIIEINTSAARRCSYSTFPTTDTIKEYRNIVGKYVTIGTDAHEVNELVSGLSDIDSLIDTYNIQPVVFEKRKMKELKPPTYI